MQVRQAIWRDAEPDATGLAALIDIAPQWVLVFGSIPALQGAQAALAQAFPNAHRMGCSTAGEISSAGVGDDSLVVTAVHWNTTRVHQSSTVLANMDDSADAGARLAAGLPRDGLKAIVVLGQGVQINGSALIVGLQRVVGDVPIVGGLAGDAGAFVKTWILDDQGVSDERVVCVGLYGEAVALSHGVFGGWSVFGPARKVTQSNGNVLMALDGEPALTIYKRYLGDYAKDLPASGLLFPFSILGKDHNEVGLIRTILGVDEAQGSLTLAGDIPEGGYLRLMHASTDALVDGAETAAKALRLPAQDPGLALMVSCVGRKLVMGGRVDEEVEAVAEVLGAHVPLAGFYSYGEISPTQAGADCLLHNQTMTITVFSETP